MSTAQTENLNFCDALRAIKAGKRAQRAGWNGKGLFAFLQTGSVHGPYLGFELAADVPADHPSTIDGLSVSLFSTSAAEDTMIRYPQLCLSFPTGTFGAWAPSQTDMLASDWVIAEDVKEEPTPEPVPVEVRQGRVRVKRHDKAVIEVLSQYGIPIPIDRETDEFLVTHPSLALVSEGESVPLYIAYLDDRINSLMFRSVHDSLFNKDISK